MLLTNVLVHFSETPSTRGTLTSLFCSIKPRRHVVGTSLLNLDNTGCDKKYPPQIFSQFSEQSLGISK